MSRIFRRVEINRRRRRKVNLKKFRVLYQAAGITDRTKIFARVQKIAPQLTLEQFLLKK